MLFPDFLLAATCSLNRRNLSKESKGDLVAGEEMRDGDQFAVVGVLTCSLGVADRPRSSAAGLKLLYVEASRDGVSNLVDTGVLAEFKGESADGDG
jgi:hypothetical protein